MAPNALLSNRRRHEISNLRSFSMFLEKEGHPLASGDVQHIWPVKPFETVAVI